jgi:hypothetical protein
MNGRKRRESGRRRYGQDAPNAGFPRLHTERASSTLFRRSGEHEDGTEARDRFGPIVAADAISFPSSALHLDRLFERSDRRALRRSPLRCARRRRDRRGIDGRRPVLARSVRAAAERRRAVPSLAVSALSRAADVSLCCRRHHHQRHRELGPVGSFHGDQRRRPPGFPRPCRRRHLAPRRQ